MSISRFLIAITMLGAVSVASAQEWPTKPVKFVSPYPPGGSVDPLARIFAAKLGESLRQQFIVENRTGASGVIGTDYVAKSAPDGYTFVFIFDTHAVHKALNPNVQFDPVKDFAPVMIVGTAPMAITTGTMKPYKNFADVLAAARTPRRIIDKLHAELVKVIKLPDVNKTLSDTLGMDVVALSPGATEKWIVEQIERWGKVVRDNNIRAE